MPTSNISNTSSPVKRPGLGRRAVSSHAVVTRTNSSDLSESQQKAAAHHKPHRAHVVHRNHHRNPSTSKNFNKLQRFQLGPETAGRHHQRKKSAPATPIASPKEGSHIRWDNAVGDHQTNPSMKRNYSTPALRRNTSAVGKKALVTERPLSSGVKKTVGFELGDDETDEAEWEDTTQSPESTRRNSVVPSNPSADNGTILVDHLTFVKRSYPQMPRATSLPESITNKFIRERAELNEDEDEGEDEDDKQHDTEDEAEESSQHTEQGDIANRLLSPSHSSKAPPAMSSISAMVKPETKNTNPASRSSASLNLAAGQDNARRTFSTTSMGSMPGSHPQATSSSMEGGVSRFILNNKNSMQASSRTDSDPTTPSSFLPHYHPQTPPSPNGGTGKSTASPARPRGADLPSRTQQKLWLQRTATLNHSPPDSHGVTAAAPPSAIDPTFIAANQRPGAGTYDAGRGLNGDGRAGGAGHDSETRHIRKAYEKTSLELTVVRRFQSPTAQSFSRLRYIARANKAQQGPALGKPVKSAPSLPLLQNGKRPKQLSSSPASKSQLRNLNPTEDPATNSDPTNAPNAAKPNDPSHRILSTSAEASRDLSGENEAEEFQANDSAMLIRRMWESREVAIHG